MKITTHPFKKCLQNNETPSTILTNSDAIGVVHGPGHMEVKYTTTGPCLVEVGTRCHGGEGTWQAIADECLGYNQVMPFFFSLFFFFFIPILDGVGKTPKDMKRKPRVGVKLLGFSIAIMLCTRERHPSLLEYIHTKK